MKWTEETKKQAVCMMNDGVDSSEIAKRFGMSKSSVKLLKYSVFLRHDEKVICQECDKRFRQITIKHLKRHGLSLEEYKKKYPLAPTLTERRINQYKTFEHPNKGKTYEEIYGESEARIKRGLISQKQIGRTASPMAGTGISGTRRDTLTYARSTYEANIDRIFIFDHKKYADEFTMPNRRFDLKKKDGGIITYQPDRVDIDGCFRKGAYLEIKGYMYPEDWEKICLFREQYPGETLMVISDDKKYANILYKDLATKYSPLIPLWECEKTNYKNRPDLYDINYVEPEREKYLRENFPEHINAAIKDGHLKFIAKKCLSYNRVSLGHDPYIVAVTLKAITNRRKGASRLSSGDYNYELWEVVTTEDQKFYVSNTAKTTLYYCYEESSVSTVWAFFEDNFDMSLRYGAKEDKTHEMISSMLWDNADDKNRQILQMINDKLLHRGKHNIGEDVVTSIKLIDNKETKCGSVNNYEKWMVYLTDHRGNEREWYVLSNYGHSTPGYVLLTIDEHLSSPSS